MVVVRCCQYFLLDDRGIVFVRNDPNRATGPVSVMGDCSNCHRRRRNENRCHTLTYAYIHTEIHNSILKFYRIIYYYFYPIIIIFDISMNCISIPSSSFSITDMTNFVVILLQTMAIVIIEINTLSSPHVLYLQ